MRIWKQIQILCISIIDFYRITLFRRVYELAKWNISLVMSVRVPIRLSVYPSVCPCAHPSVRVSFCLSVCPSVCPCILLSVRVPIRLSVYPSACPYTDPSVRTPIRLSGHLPFSPSVHLCLSVRIELLAYHRTEFHEISYLIIFCNTVSKILFSLKPNKNSWYFAWRCFCVCDNISFSFS